MSRTGKGGPGDAFAPHERSGLGPAEPSGAEPSLILTTTPAETRTIIFPPLWPDLTEGMRFIVRHPPGESGTLRLDEDTETRALIADLAAALRGVVRVADRNTVEFDAARAALARVEGGKP